MGVPLTFVTQVSTVEPAVEVFLPEAGMGEDLGDHSE